MTARHPADKRLLATRAFQDDRLRDEIVNKSTPRASGTGAGIRANRKIPEAIREEEHERREGDSPTELYLAGAIE